MPAKKFFDIYPPKRIKKEKFLEPLPKSPERKPFPKSPLFPHKSLFLIFFFLGFLIIFFHFSAKAEIEIWPKKEKMAFEEKVIVDTKVLNSDFSKKIIFGKSFSTEKEISQEFDATGIGEKKLKAEGIIRVFNNYHLPQTLVVNTRFISAEGKLFYSKNKINVPAGQYLDVEVIAAEPGPEYNIKPTTFSIPGLLGSPRYHAVYGKSLSQMKGGFLGKVLIVSKEDLERAKNNLFEKLSLQLKEELQNLAAPEFILLEKAIENEILDLAFSKEEGKEAEKFESSLKMRSKSITFKESEIKDFLKESVSKEIKENKKIKEDSLKIEHFIEKMDFEGGKIFLKLHISTEIYSDIDLGSLKESLKEKSLKESEISLRFHPEIERARIRIWPFWIRKIPKTSEKIKINLNLD